MRITVVTVCRNAVSTIEHTIRSVSEQSYQDVEYVIVDGGSTDGTQDVVRKCGGSITRFLSESDNGTYDAMNKGLALATGDVVGFLNADDVFADSTVLGQIAAVFQDQSTAACYADLVYVKKDDIDSVVRYWKSSSYEHGDFASGWCPAHPTFYARRSVYERYGNFDLAYRLAADADLMIRFLEKAQVSVVYVPSIWVKMRVGGQTNLSFGNIVRQNREILDSLSRHGIRASPSRFIFSKVWSRILQRWSRTHV
ncbi:MAG: glycosyltransferase family 2 protein [Thiogranum sp.]|nr:glycosyltransferase family 2 protein [Thiogranum sp.]